eukprot:COSAG03_NODE_1953_length_3304_cov_1.921997_3_plen_313_part_00
MRPAARGEWRDEAGTRDGGSTRCRAAEAGGGCHTELLPLGSRTFPRRQQQDDPHHLASSESQRARERVRETEQPHTRANMSAQRGTRAHAADSINMPNSDGEEMDGVSARFWLAFACPLLVMVHQGVWGGFTSPVLSANCGDQADSSSGSSPGGDESPCPHCMNCELDLSDQLQSIFVAAPSLVQIPLALLGGGCTDYFGRRTTTLIGGLVSLAGWGLMFVTPVPDAADALKLHSSTLILQLETPTWLMVFAGRLMAAMGSTLQVIACSVWVSESTPSAIRGGVMTYISFGWCSGTCPLKTPCSVATHLAFI